MQSKMLKTVLKVTVIAGALLTAGLSSAAVVDVYLQTQAFDKDIPNNDGMGGTIPVRMWGFAECDSGWVCQPVNSPGPRINATTADTLNIHVQNTLNTPVSVIIPGQATNGTPVMFTDTLSRSRVRSMTTETAPGSTTTPTTQTYTWAAPKAGTYLYQSGTMPSLQVPMGLYGALVVTDSGTAGPYADISANSEALLMFSELDPIQNQRLDNAAAVHGTPTQVCESLKQYNDPMTPSDGYPCSVDYFPVITLVNGAPAASTTSTITAGDTVILRLLNAGQRTHVPAIFGYDMDLIAEDGNRYPGNFRRQSEASLPAGKTLDALIYTDSMIPDVTLDVFDRGPAFNNETGNGAIAGVIVGTGSPLPGPSIHAVNDEYAVPEDAMPYIGATVVTNDIVEGGLTAPVTVTKNADVSHGSLTLNPDGTFVYTPSTDFSGTDTFTYSATDATLNTYPAQVNLNVSFLNDAPVANDDGPYVNTITTTLTVDAAHGVLGNDSDADGDTLTAILDTAPATGTVECLDPVMAPPSICPDGSFTFTGTAADSFTYHAEDGALSSAYSPTVTIDFNPVANIMLNVTDPALTPVGSYRWIVQEDVTFPNDPETVIPIETTLAVNFHKSYMPVVAQGCTGAECDPDNADIPIASFTDVALDPAKRYYVSVLPNDAGTGEGHTLGGAQIAAGASNTSIDVIVNNQPIPPAQISVIVFEDKEPTNGVPDPNEAGLAGFEVLIEDAAGRFGQSPGFVSQDVDGNPLLNAKGDPGNPAYDPGCFPGAPPPTGVVLTCADGTALIQNMPPGKFGIIISPPAGPDTWTQTSTIEGTPVQDTWVKPNEPPFLVEFGAPGYHAFIGFVNPARTCLQPAGGPPPAPDDPCTPRPPGGGPDNSVTGHVTMIHTARAPDATAYDTGNYNALSHTRPWVGLNSVSGDGPNVATVQADLVESGDELLAQFNIDGIPDGTYQLVIWDDYLDQIIYYQTVILSGGGMTDVGNIPVPTWFGRQEHTVFLDMNENGQRDNEDPEIGLTEQAVNLRFRDGTIFQSFPTDSTGFVPFDQVFPFGAWQIAEIDYTRYWPTGARIWVDGGGPVGASSFPGPGLNNPTPMSPRTETDPELPVLLEGFQSMPGMNSIFEWGKRPYGPDENGGIAGIVFYGSTRGENDPRLTVGDTWEPGIPNVTVRLYREIETEGGGTALRLVDEVQTDSWDAGTPDGCEGEDPTSPFVTQTLAGDADHCFDGIRNWEQVRNGAVFDGGYAFGGLGSEHLEPGAYVVEVVPPPGYQVIKEEDKNVDFGDVFAVAPVPMMLASAMLVTLPDAPTVEQFLHEKQQGILAPPCVGPTHHVPDYLSLFSGSAAVATLPPFAGADRPLCNRKRVILSNGGNAAADFHLFTSTPVAGQFYGLSTDDIAIETNQASPQFGDKWGPPFMPVSQRDWQGHEVYRGYTDAFGLYNGMVPSTFSANVPIPSGYSPGMYSVCLNDPYKADGTPDLHHLPQYGNFCYTLMYMPGTTTYLDTPLLPQAAFAAGFFPADCALPAGYPVVMTVDGDAMGIGPLATVGGSLEITSAGTVAVPNPAYDGPLGSPAPETVPRNYGFGTTAGTVRLGNITLASGAVTWGDATITADLTGIPAGEYELVITNAAGHSTINTVTVTVSNTAAAAVVSPPLMGDFTSTPIQDAIDAAAPGALILVQPGMYNELLIMSKPVRLQGAGASTIINAVKLPPDKLKTWQDDVVALVEGGTIDLLPGQPDQFDLVGPGLMAQEQGGGITVFASNDSASPSYFPGTAARIDGFTITGADGGGGIFVNGWAHGLVISNNNVTGNSGVLHGGIRVGHPALPLAGTAPFAFNTGVNIHHNSITFNGGQADQAVGGGVSICTGTDNYTIDHNYICGNFNLGDGAGIGHYGLSNNGHITNNQILFNQNFNQGLGANGGGLLIAGEPAAATPLTLGSGNVVIDSNLIQGNQAGSGKGGGVRTQFVNGEDVAASPNPNNWWALRFTNNMIVNNVAGWSGAGMSFQDTARASIVLNTIANNDSTGTVGSIIGLGPQPAGISSDVHSLGLAALPGSTTFSDPDLRFNIIWHNRAFTYSVDAGPGGTPALLPQLTVSAPGACGTGANYFDLGVIAGTPAMQLHPLRSILTDITGYATNNVAVDPQLVNAYCNTARDLTNAPMQVATEPTEGGNATDVRFGPLSREWPLESGTLWNYHLLSTSPAIDRDGPQPSGANVTHDIDGDPRPTNGPPPGPARADWGADEWVAP